MRGALRVLMMYSEWLKGKIPINLNIIRERHNPRVN